MPMTFTDEDVRERAEAFNIPLEPAEGLRERVARRVETQYEDYVEGWEIRTGRPWISMTAEEARELVRRHPPLIVHQGVLSRLRSA